MLFFIVLQSLSLFYDIFKTLRPVHFKIRITSCVGKKSSYVTAFGTH